MTLAQLDDLAHAMEMKWGIDRLPRLMPTAWQAKFDALKSALDGVISAGTDTAAAAEALAKAWRMMDAKATEQGSEPMPAACYSVRMDDGEVSEFALSDEHLRVLDWRARTEGRKVKLFTLANYARLCEAAGLAVDTLALWPGATVTTPATEFRPGKRRMNIADDIPFPNPEAGEAA